jgi:thimet oligopeptidase|tara:strand:+ start:14113 stop:16200 length:2088 start_codon:yes stop_codon:yes gene_type:complete
MFKLPSIRIPLRYLIYLFVVLVVFGCKNGGENPLLISREDPINFSLITPDHIQEATDHVLYKANKLLKNIYKIGPSQKSFKNTLLPLDDIANIIENVWSPVSLLAFTHPDKGIRDAGLKATQEFEEFFNSISVDEKLYNAVVDFSTNANGKMLVDLEKKFLHETLRDFNRSGFGHGESVRNRVKTMLDQLTPLSLKFEKNISESKDTLFLREHHMIGLSADYSKNRKKEDGIYTIDLSYPSYSPFMKYAESDSARKALRFMYWNRASDKNLTLLDSLILIRNQLAEILDYPSYADYVTEILMSENANRVWEFEKSLHEMIMPKALDDYNRMLEMKSLETGKYESVIESWEYDRYEHLLKLKQFRLDSKKISEYFELTGVINGLFEICTQLFGIQFSQVDNPSVWHEEVTMYEVYEEADSILIGRFYLDLFPRTDKYSHAAAFSVTMGKLMEDEYQIPATALVCNFPPPQNGKPSLLPHEDVETFFHEFGHLLHDILTVSPLQYYSGTSVLQDFVEAPSQILENWVWEKEILKLFAHHYETGEVIPDRLVNKMIAAKNVNSGLNTLQQIFYGVYDFTLHDGFDPFGEFNSTDLAELLQNEITLYPYLEGTHMQASFGHLVGYEAAYYGYLWSKVYAQDMYSVFKGNGILDPETGRRFRKVIFESGGTVHPKLLVQEFLGREPNMDAFLASLGIQKN